MSDQIEQLLCRIGPNLRSDDPSNGQPGHVYICGQCQHPIFRLRGFVDPWHLFAWCPAIPIDIAERNRRAFKVSMLNGIDPLGRLPSKVFPLKNGIRRPEN